MDFKDEYINKSEAILAVTRDGCTANVVGVLYHLPPADVVPKIEIDRLQHILDSYALQYGTVMDKHIVIEKERAEVAREIFKEIEKYMDEDDGLSVYMTRSEFYELKEKYTEDVK